jgi:hypothetical protein
MPIESAVGSIRIPHGNAKLEFHHISASGDHRFPHARLAGRKHQPAQLETFPKCARGHQTQAAAVRQRNAAQGCLKEAAFAHPLQRPRHDQFLKVNALSKSPISNTTQSRPAQIEAAEPSPFEATLANTAQAYGPCHIGESDTRTSCAEWTEWRQHPFRQVNITRYVRQIDILKDTRSTEWNNIQNNTISNNQFERPFRYISLRKSPQAHSQ